MLILTAIGFSERDYKRMGIDILKKRFKIEVLDFTELFHPNYQKKSREKVYKCDGYYKIDSMNNIYKFLKSRNAQYAFDRLGNLSDSLKVKRYLNINNVKLIFYQAGLVPKNIRTKKEFLIKLIKMVLSPSIFYKKIKNKIKEKLIIKPDNIYYDFVVISGTKGLDKIKNIKVGKKIHAHSRDYEAHIMSGEKNHLKFENYAVFLDQFLPFHPGAIYRGEKSKATKEIYYPAMNNFFTKLEKKHKLKVIISAHPRSDDELNKKLFESRTSLKNKTLELVKNSKIVIAHTSTSIAFAIIYKKPIIFLTSNEIRNSYDDYYIDSLSREINSQIINIDNCDEELVQKLNFNQINQSRYEQYYENYIKFPHSKNESMWKIVLDGI